MATFLQIVIRNGQKRYGISECSNQATLERNGRSIWNASRSIVELDQSCERCSHKLDAQPRPRNHLQIALVSSAHGMLASIGCTQHIGPSLVASQVFN